MIISILLLFPAFYAHSQTTLLFKFSPIGIHAFKEPNVDFFENKLDANARFVLEPTFVLGCETFVYDDALSLRFMVGGLGDAVSKPAAFLQIGMKYKLFQVYRSCLALGAGFVGYGRERRLENDGFAIEKGWHANGNWEYGIGGLGEIEYILVLAERHDLLFSLVYGLQQKTFSATIGYRFWISTHIKNPKKCGSCPFGGGSKGKKWHY